MKQTISTTKGVFVFSTTIIGAGILALPVAAAHSGFFPLLAVLALMAAVSALSAIYIAEAILCSDGAPHLPSLAREQLGNWGMAAMLAGTMVYIYGALVGYLTAGGQLLHHLSEGAVPVRAGILLYFTVTAVVIQFGVILVSYVETYLFYVMLVLLGAVIALSAPQVDVELLHAADWSSSLGVFGVVLFAFVGHSVIPSVAGRLERKERILAIAILGVAVPFLLYVVWSLVVIGIVPAASQGGHSLAAAKAQGQPATIPLGFIVGGSVIVLGNVFAVVSTMTSYIGFGLSLKDEYANASDTLGRSIPSWISILAVVLPPLAVALHSPEGFIRMLDAAGAYGGGLFVGVLPALMVIRLNRKRCGALFVSRKIRLLPYAVLLVYLTGIFYTAWQQFR